MANECNSFAARGALRRTIAWSMVALSALAGAHAAADSTPAADSARLSLSLAAPANRLESGGATQYSVRIENSGGRAEGARLKVGSPEGLSNRSWTCTASGSSSCAHASGQGDLDEPLDGLSGGEALVYLVDADVAAQPPAFVSIAASSSLVAGARCANDATSPCRTSLSLPTGPSLHLDLAASAAAAGPGQAVQYTISLRPDSARSSTLGTRLRSPLPKGLVNASWSCQSSAGACSIASGSGDIDEMLGEFAGADVRFTVNAKVAAQAPQRIVVAAVAIPPFGGSCAAPAGSGAGARPAPCAARLDLPTGAWIMASRSPDYSVDGSIVENRFMLVNRGTSANGSTVSMTLPEHVSAISWTCSGIGATCPQASGNGAIEQTVASWPTNGTLQYDIVSYRVSAAASLTELRMTVSPPGSARCGAASLAPPCLAQDVANPAQSFLRIGASVDRLGAAPGQEVVYTLVAANDSADRPADALVLDFPLPAGIERFSSWTCDAAGGASSCPLESGSGPIRQRIASLAPSSALTYTVHARVAESAPARIMGTARLVAPAAASLGCRNTDGNAAPCVAQTDFASVAVLALDQTRLAGNLVPGGAASYSLDVSNLGADAQNVRIDNLEPIGFSAAAWACTGLGVGCPAASGQGKVTASLAQMPANSSLHYQVSGRVSNVPPDTISNVLMAIPPVTGRCHRNVLDSLGAIPCVDRTDTGVRPLLALTQSANEHQLIVGGTANYLVTLKNLGSLANGALLNVPLPEGIERFDWTCTGFAGAVCPTASSTGPINEAIPELPADASLSYAIRAMLDPAAATSVTNVATVTAPTNGGCIDDDCTASTSLPLTAVPSAHLDVSLKSARIWAPPGSDPSWTIDIRNLGTEVATDFRIENPLAEDGLTILSWTCAGVECPAAQGTGPISQTVESLAVYDSRSDEATIAPGRIVFTMTGHVDGNPAADVKLSAAVTPARGDTCAPVSCEANLPLPTSLRGAADVTIDLQADSGTAIPNSTINYTLTLIVTSGIGPIDFDVFTVLPPEIASATWTCIATGGGGCPASGSGAINVSLTSMPDLSTATFSIVAQTGSNVQPSVDFLAGVNVAAGIFCTPASCTNTLSIPGQDELTLTLNADVTSILPGGMVQYTYRAQNTGGGNLFGIGLATIQPPEIVSSSWTCTASGGANCAPAGTGPVNDLISSIPIGGVVTYTIDAIAGSTLPPSIVYQGTAGFGAQPVPPQAPQGVLNCVPFGCVTTLALPRGSVAPASLRITKTADQTLLLPGGNVRYTIDIDNIGSVDSDSVQFFDAIPAGITSFAWTCTSTGDISCPQPSGTGAISETFGTIPIASSLTYVVDAVVSANASGSVSNRASLVGSNINCSPSSCQAVATVPVALPAAIAVTKVAAPASGTPVSNGQSIAWTLRANNTSGATRDPVVLTDVMPTTVSAISVVAGTGVTCNTSSPAPGATLTCTIAAGFTGERTVEISATVAASAGAVVANTVSATGPDGPVCVACSVSNPVIALLDVSLANPRAFSAAGIPGTLIDVANMSSISAPASTLTVTPASSLRLLAASAGSCTATTGADGSINVTCPNPPSSQGIQCAGNTCSLASLPANSAATFFVALNPGTSATVTANVPGDADTSDNTIVLPIGGTP